MSVRNVQGASIEELVQEYEQAAVAYGQALSSANHRAANRAHDRIAGAYRELRSRAAAAQLLPLLRSENENVRSIAAAHALEFAPEQGELVLQELATRPGRIRTRAEYALKAWREGTLKFP
ncbi:DUF2019 domain-containing protein [Pyxidicoccus parkwayensis]|uniref:DUF2019 domain-containing protein n=1 Tax=Pyxidicoccus parkwayensis TaxID=2813578 RepID=A0ABX7P9G9_9BACT|nr:DUF2019 domain-containing protein [Pyxidicoccus parkwaysis]QSQ27121.1 DUF2019 domain-containing protein [Pyxidicoccus parkwaysis]